MISYSQLAVIEAREDDEAVIIAEGQETNPPIIGASELTENGFTDASVLLAEVVVYALFDGPRCIYVGQSSQVQIRIQTHRSRGRVFDRVWMKATTRENALAEERIWIGMLAPAYNIVGTNKIVHRDRASAEVKAEGQAILAAVGLLKPKPLIRRPLFPPPVPELKRRQLGT